MSPSKLNRKLPLRQIPGRGLFYYLFWVAALACLISGCAGGGAGQGGGSVFFERPAASHVVEEVPFFAQERHQCGPASLAGVMQYRGRRVTPEEVAGAVYRPDLRGSVSLDLVLYARGKKLPAEWYRGGPRDLIKRIDEQSPLVVMVDQGIGPIRQLHYMVIVGYTPQAVIANSGLEEHKQIAWDEFLGQWERTNYWTLLIGA